MLLNSQLVCLRPVGVLLCPTSFCAINIARYYYHRHHHHHHRHCRQRHRFRFRYRYCHSYRHRDRQLLHCRISVIVLLYMIT